MYRNGELGTFIIRLMVGITFFIHGWQKFHMGIGNVAGFFGKIGLPGFLAYPVGILEVVGGILLLIGLGIRIVSALFVVDMLGAILTAKLSAGFVGGYEFELALLVMSLHLFISGNRIYSLEKMFLDKRIAE